MFSDQQMTFPTGKSRLTLGQGFNKLSNPGRRNHLRTKDPQAMDLSVLAAPWIGLLSCGMRSHMMGVVVVTGYPQTLVRFIRSSRLASAT